MTWKRLKLKSLGVEVQTGFASGRHGGEGELLHLRPMNITPLGKLTTETGKFVRNDSGDQRVRQGDVLFNNTNSPKWVGKTAYVSAPEPVAFSNHMSRLRVPDDHLDARFLAMQLHHMQGVGFFESICSNHVNQASVSRQRLLEVEVWVPPLDEQRRIVAVLEDHLSRLDAAEAYLRSSERRVEAWRSAAIQSELWAGGPVERPVGELLREGLRNGRSDRAVRGSEVGTRTLTLTAVTRNQFTDEFTKLTSTPKEIAQGLWLQPGDILVQRSNTPELVGTAARYAGPKNWAIFPDLLIRLRPDESVVDSRFLVAALRSEKVHRTLRSRAKGLAGSMPKIDQRSIAETLVPVPSKSRQADAIGHINQIDATADVAVAQIARQWLRSRALRRALFMAAFSGRLTGSAEDLSEVEEMMPA